MAKFARVAITTVFTAVGTALGGPIGAMIGTFIGTFVGTLLLPPSKGKPRGAASETLRIGEVPRQAIVGRAATAGSLVDAFNYGGKYGTDWEVLVIALADHRCDALEGVYINDSYVAFAGDGAVAGYNNQLSLWWRPGTETQTVPSVLTANGPGWTANDNGAGVSYVVVAYKADASDAKNPVWPNGRPRFLFVLRGALCYDSRLDSTVGGVGAHRWSDPSTWAFSENPIVTRYKFARGLYACDRVSQPEQLLVGRGLSAVEAPPQNLFHRANLCDELVDGEQRYRVGGLIEATEPYIDIENDFAAACAGTIVQPEGAVEIDPGEAKAPVMTITDADLVVGSKVKRRWFLGIADRGWVNSVVASYIEPGQKWAAHTAPVRRDIADIQADGAPREEALQLGFVLWQKQAGRIAEIVRRLGRLHVRAELVLPPRFCELEEGDWIVWQSDRYLNGQAFTFRIEAWGSDRNWQHSVVLRQISASCYADTAPLTDGSVAVQQPARPAIGAPSAPNWSLSAGHLSAGGIRTPALIVSGASDDPSARFVRMEYVQGVTVPNAGTVWSDAGVTGPDVKRREIAVAAGGVYRVGISYVVDGIQGDRLILGPVTALGVAYPDGTLVENVQPGEPGATVGAVIGDNLRKSDDSVPVQSLIITPEGTAAAIAGQGALATANQAAYGSQISGLPSPISPANLLASGSRLSAAFMQYTGGPTIESLQPSQAGADVTSTKTAAAIAGQGAFATVNSAAYGSGLLTGFGTLAPRSTILAGSHLRNSADTVFLGDVDIITPQGTAAAIAGQADWATYSGINTTNMAGRVSALDTSGNLSAIDKITNRRLTLLRRADNVTAVSEPDLVTILGTAAAITGQAPAATDATIQAGATNDTGSDTRAVDSPPLHYRQNWLRRLRTEFKNRTTIGSPTGSTGVYGSLESYSAWTDQSGGPVWQRFTDDSGRRFIRYSTGTTPTETWLGWEPEYSGNRKPFFGTDLLETSGGVVATLPNFKTISGTSAGITGQTDWATYTGINTTNMAGRVSALDTGGNLSALDKVTNRRMTLLKRADGTTDLTEALAITSLGTAAAIAGQGAFATVNSAAYGSALLTGFGTLAPRSTVLAGSHLRNSADTVFLGDVDIITPQGTAAAIAGQAATATSSDFAAVTGGTKPSDNATSDIRLVVTGTGLLLQGNRAYRPTGGGAWDSQCYSLEGHRGGAYCAFVGGTASVHGFYMAGLNTDPTTDASYTSLDFAWYQAGDATLSIFESNVFIGSFGTYAFGDVLSVVYDGVNVRYMQNGIVRRTVAGPANAIMHFDSSVLSGEIRNIKFGALSNNDFSAIGGAGKPEANADVTITAQVTPVKPDDVTINADYLGAILGGQFNKVLTPLLTRGGVSVRTDNRASYTLSNVTGGLVGFVSVNNTNGSADKGRYTVTDCTSTGTFQINISWDGVLIATYTIRFNVVPAAAPVGGGGGGGTKAGTVSITGQSISSTSFVSLGQINNLTKAAGETIRCSLPVAEYHVQHTANSTRSALVKFQYSPTGANSWTDVGTAVTGSASTWLQADFSYDTGSVTVSQNVAPANAAYDIRVVAAMNTTGGGTIIFDSGTMSVIIGV